MVIEKYPVDDARTSDVNLEHRKFRDVGTEEIAVAVRIDPDPDNPLPTNVEQIGGEDVPTEGGAKSVPVKLMNPVVAVNNLTEVRDINRVGGQAVPTEGGLKSIPVKLMNPTVAVNNLTEIRDISKVGGVAVPTEAGVKSVPVKVMNPTVAVNNLTETRDILRVGGEDVPTAEGIKVLPTTIKGNPPVAISRVGTEDVPVKGAVPVLPAAIYDAEGNQITSFGGIATDLEDITPNDSTELVGVIGFKSLSDGTIKVDTPNGTRIIDVLEGDLEPCVITKFYATDSDVAKIRIYKS